MDNDLIERLAREAGFGVMQEDGTIHVMGNECDGELRRLVALVAEECAKVAEETFEAEAQGERVYGEESAKAIRTKFEAPA